MLIEVRVAVENGWLKFLGDAPEGSDLECYALEKKASRADFWSKKLDYDIPNGRGLIWEVIDD